MSDQYLAHEDPSREHKSLYKTIPSRYLPNINYRYQRFVFFVGVRKDKMGDLNDYAGSYELSGVNTLLCAGLFDYVIRLRAPGRDITQFITFFK